MWVFPAMYTCICIYIYNGTPFHFTFFAWISQQLWAFSVFVFSVSVFCLTYAGWSKIHFTLLKANKIKPNVAKKIVYVSNQTSCMGICLLMRNIFIVWIWYPQMLSIAMLSKLVRILFTALFINFSKISGLILLISLIMLPFNSYKILGLLV